MKIGRDPELDLVEEEVLVNFVTEERCRLEIQSLKEKKLLLKHTCDAEKEHTIIDAKIAIWERISHHLKQGKVITIDELTRLKLWDDVKTA